jgi:uncharacterized membrane protein YcgQ (UPF0703/DUF1980 family)
MEIPVYLFTGFLESGKTSFIQKTLEDPRFNQGENTLLLLCEEGEVDYDSSTFASQHIFIETIESPDELTPFNLDLKCKKHACERVIVEYNGMWILDAFYAGMPKEWLVYQEFMFVDARSFLQYNKNLRELVVDKLNSCEMVIFNRADGNLDQIEFHKIVRAISRRTEIVYEDETGNVTYDQIPDELPFDLNAPIVSIALEDYAAWYRDISEEMEKYVGKTVKLSGYAILRKDLPENTFIFGRQVMTCCADDLTFAGVLCIWKDKKKLKHQDWVEVTAKVELRHHKIYGRKGPIFQVLDLEHHMAPKQDVATFY